MSDPTNRRAVSVFLDANVIYAASFSERGGSSRLWALECCQLVTNEYALIEAHENLRKLESAEVLARFDLLMQRVEVVGYIGSSPSLFVDVSWCLPDPNDEPILAGAIDSECDYLLTLDGRCFGALYGQTIGGVRIAKVGTFLSEMGA